MPDLEEFERQATARALSCAQRVQILAAERGQLALRAKVQPAHPEFLGLVSFETWLMDSGRVADRGGSPWWRTVNGLLLMDIAESARSGGSADRAGPVHSWLLYRNATSMVERREAWWAAHQHSLEVGRAAADSLLAGELPEEQAFIATSLGSVRLAGAAKLSTRRIGSWAISEFCSTFYPDGYPAGDQAGNAGSELLERHSERWMAGLRITRSLLNQRWKSLLK